MQFKQFVALVACVLTGCTANRDLGDGGAPAPIATASVVTSSPPQGAVAVTPDLVVDVNDLAARAAAPIICRDLLKPNSNVIVRQCLTEADWKRYKNAEAQKAAQIVRMMQGGAYR